MLSFYSEILVIRFICHHFSYSVKIINYKTNLTVQKGKTNSSMPEAVEMAQKSQTFTVLTKAWN